MGPPPSQQPRLPAAAQPEASSGHHACNVASSAGRGASTQARRGRSASAMATQQLLKFHNTHCKKHQQHGGASQSSVTSSLLASALLPDPVVSVAAVLFGEVAEASLLLAWTITKPPKTAEIKQHLLAQRCSKSRRAGGVGTLEPEPGSRRPGVVTTVRA